MEVRTNTGGGGDIVVTSGLRAYFTFDDGEVKDMQGNFQGVPIGASISTDSPVDGGLSMYCDGDGDFLQFNGNPFRNTNSQTIHASISVWVKTTSGGAVFAIPFVDDDGNNELVVGITENKVRHSIRNRLGNRPGSGNTWGEFNIDVSTLLLDEKWHMLTITYDGAINKSRLFIDGIGWSEDDYEIYGTINAGVSRIGVDYYNGGDIGGISDFNGLMDNIRFYTRPLSDSEVLEIFNARQ